MSNIAIQVEGLSKKYTIGTAKSGSFRETFSQLLGRSSNKAEEEFWALKDLNFEIKHGEAVGIIGRNGAGKSTLLKVLSRITEPTSGRITINGRVSSLLEVGTGFHPELTGRENIFLNGTILGMTRKEVKAKFDEIVDFSGVEKFIDTPVKRYSSGMYVRLAFAVAAHLEPEILIVDEVLAVGDAEFQKKCLGKMGEVAGEGRTVLFVSHNMQAVKTLCNKGTVLDKGGLVEIGDVRKCLERYQNLERSSSCTKVYSEGNRPSSEWAELIGFSLKNATGQEINSFNLYENAFLEIDFRVKEKSSASDAFYPNLHVFDENNQYLTVTSVSKADAPSTVGAHKMRFELPSDFFNVGFYRIGIALTSYPGTHVHFFVNPALSFEVTEEDFSLRTLPYTGPIPGVIRRWLPYQTIKL